jgi:hypothetical protein
MRGNRRELCIHLWEHILFVGTRVDFYLPTELRRGRPELWGIIKCECPAPPPWAGALVVVTGHSHFIIPSSPGLPLYKIVI